MGISADLPAHCATPNDESCREPRPRTRRQHNQQQAQPKPELTVLLVEDSLPTILDPRYFVRDSSASMMVLGRSLNFTSQLVFVHYRCRRCSRLTLPVAMQPRPIRYLEQ